MAKAAPTSAVAAELRAEAARLIELAEAERVASGAMTNVAEGRKQGAIAEAVPRLSMEDVLEAMAHDRELARLARAGELTQALTRLYRDHLELMNGVWQRRGRAIDERELPWEPVLAAVVALAFLVFAWLIW